jgi:hypothetical protein
MENSIELKNNEVILINNSGKYIFKNYELSFSEKRRHNIFSEKNNKTLMETLKNKRYSKFFGEVMKHYKDGINKKLGDFLIELKNNNDIFYKNFLNKYGDEIYVEFKISDNSIYNLKGLYLYISNNILKYIGKTNDTISKRINNGYGKIHPKNCYIDGQSTNCHINALIAKNINGIKFYFLELKDIETIDKLEDEFIKKYNPEWNIMLKGK